MADQTGVVRLLYRCLVDEGRPIAYRVLGTGVPVLASDGSEVGSVGSVLSAPEQDIFHGLLINTPHQGLRFVEADAIASIHEYGVDLRLDPSAVEQLPGPEHSAPVFDEDPGKQQEWRHWLNRLTGRGDWNRER